MHSLMETRQNPLTGGDVGLYYAGDDAGPWSTHCDVHGTRAGHPTFVMAQEGLGRPDGWCIKCRETLSRESPPLMISASDVCQKARYLVRQKCDALFWNHQEERATFALGDGAAVKIALIGTLRDFFTTETERLGLKEAKQAIEAACSHVWGEMHPPVTSGTPARDVLLRRLRRHLRGAEKGGAGIVRDAHLFLLEETLRQLG